MKERKIKNENILYLPKHPVHYFNFQSRIFRKKSSVFFGKIQHNGSRLEKTDRFAPWSIAVNCTRDFGIGVDADEPTSKLVPFGDIEN